MCCLGFQTCRFFVKIINIRKIIETVFFLIQSEGLLKQASCHNVLECAFLSCRIHVFKWIYTLYLSESLWNNVLDRYIDLCSNSTGG